MLSIGLELFFCVGAGLEGLGAEADLTLPGTTFLPASAGPQ